MQICCVKIANWGGTGLINDKWKSSYKKPLQNLIYQYYKEYMLHSSTFQKDLHLDGTVAEIFLGFTYILDMQYNTTKLNLSLFTSKPSAKTVILCQQYVSGAEGHVTEKAAESIACLSNLRHPLSLDFTHLLVLCSLKQFC